MLTQEEINLAQSFIDKLPPGTYTLPKIYGSNWNKVADPNGFGKLFKLSVLDNRFKNIHWISEKTSDNKQQYIISI